MTRFSRMLNAVVVAAVVVSAVAGTARLTASSPKFFDDDPLWVEPETQDASRIARDEVNLFADLASNLIRGPRIKAGVPALNVNTVGEVPDSSWFTNRVGLRPIAPDDVRRGPTTDEGPAAGAWTIVSSKSDGVTPGFTVLDDRGQRWFLKFDPRGYRAMATGTEVAVSRLMWALGYNVPENHIAYARRERFVIGSEARYTPPGGTARRMRASDVDRLLEQVEQEADGSYRLVASKALAGAPVGRIRFIGTRPDDPNDLVPHEHRRELRAYGVFAAWLNHVDAKAINSLDTLVKVNGRSIVRHHLIDFGSALGSGGVAPADYWGGEEYLVEPGQVATQMASLGFQMPKWRTRRYYEAPAVGRLPERNDDFNPDIWRPRVPNPAFLHATPDDKFWAARRLAAMRIDLIRAAVSAGEFDDPRSEEFLVRALAERRDAIVRAYLGAVNPITDVKLRSDGQLTFSNAAMEADAAVAPAAYQAVWSRFDNATRTTTEIGTTTSRGTSMMAPDRLPDEDGAYLKVALTAAHAERPSWNLPVDAYFRNIDGGWRLIGLERAAR